MCGLVGIIHRKGKAIDRETLVRMLSVLHHRGPDEDGYMVDDAVGFGHKRLTIIDTVSGSQPMDADGLTIVFNGEIYNYIELRDELIQLGHTFRTKSDTEVILRMYLQFGESCVARLNGMFAFLIYDRTRQRVLAARDHQMRILGSRHVEEHLARAAEIDVESVELGVPVGGSVVVGRVAGEGGPGGQADHRLASAPGAVGPRGVSRDRVDVGPVGR